MVKSISGKNLIWLPEKGVGYFPVDAFPYDKNYFEKYEGYAATELGKSLTEARLRFVSRHHKGDIVDVGIGSGQFIEAHGSAKGFDVNPYAQAWLKERDLWCDIYAGKICAALTFWDSLEHIDDIALAVSRAEKFVFVSIPIFLNSNHVLSSKHYRKDEHFWYFTERGFVNWFAEQGFELLGQEVFEQDLGREDIGTFAFGRKS